jgi:hypothetical protein
VHLGRDTAADVQGGPGESESEQIPARSWIDRMSLGNLVDDHRNIHSWSSCSPRVRVYAPMDASSEMRNTSGTMARTTM